MRVATQLLNCAILAMALAASASGQTSPAAPLTTQDQLQPAATTVPSETAAQEAPSDAPAAPAQQTVQQRLDAAETGIKFDVRALMEILRDRRHEGLVLAAYPDPRTGQPLIGAGVSLDLPAREHPQLDPLNPHPFLEPSSAELWQAAGLDSTRLQAILDRFDQRLAAWSKKGFRKRIRTLEPQITEEEANLLLRVSALQAIYNARAYCRSFDGLTASQQMALSQLVYQMGVNLQAFTQFLAQINSDSVISGADVLPVAHSALSTDAEYWKAVQQSLVQSQWARLYRVRAISVIAMLDPQYADAPASAERRVGAMLRPAVVHRHKGRTAALHQVASRIGPETRERAGGVGRKSKVRQQRKRKT